MIGKLYFGVEGVNALEEPGCCMKPSAGPEPGLVAFRLGINNLRLPPIGRARLVLKKDSVIRRLHERDGTFR